VRKSYPCASGLHSHHTNKAATEACAEYAATMRRLGQDAAEQHRIEDFDREDDGDDPDE
jgi:hypothetical protein